MKGNNTQNSVLIPVIGLVVSIFTIGLIITVLIINKKKNENEYNASLLRLEEAKKQDLFNKKLGEIYNKYVGSWAKGDIAALKETMSSKSFQGLKKMIESAGKTLKEELPKLAKWQQLYELESYKYVQYIKSSNKSILFYKGTIAGEKDEALIVFTFNFEDEKWKFYNVTAINIIDTPEALKAARAKHLNFFKKYILQ